jgi:Domain of unknown function (DUF4136)
LDLKSKKQNLKKMKTLIRTFMVVSMTWGLFGCYPEGPEYVDELDIVYTNYDPSFDFKALGTFALPDNVIKLDGKDFKNNNGEDIPEFVSPQYAMPILNAIRDNMEDMGWTQVAKTENPDVILLPSVSKDTHVYYYYDWYYWNWWYPGWNSRWGWYYSGYYYPAFRGGYSTGTLFIQMTNAKSGNPDNVPVIWSSEINGLVQGSSSYLISRINKTIDQAFLQSPYLQQ